MQQQQQQQASHWCRQSCAGGFLAAVWHYPPPLPPSCVWPVWSSTSLSSLGSSRGVCNQQHVYRVPCIPHCGFGVWIGAWTLVMSQRCRQLSSSLVIKSAATSAAVLLLLLHNMCSCGRLDGHYSGQPGCCAKQLGTSHSQELTETTTDRCRLLRQKALQQHSVRPSTQR